MKTIRWPWSASAFLSFALAGVVSAQVGTTTTTAPADDPTSVVTATPTADSGVPTGSNSLASSSDLVNLGIWQNTIKDWHSTDWQMNYMGTNAVTGALEPRVAKFQEVGGGINYIGENGIWARSMDLIELMPASVGGAAALHGPLKVWFSPTIGADGPTIQLTTHSNVVLQIQPVAIYYVDAQGNSALLATIKPDSAGELLPPNQVIYRGVTTNGISASVKYTYTHGAFESDLLLLSQPTQTPDMLGLDPLTARLTLVHLVSGPLPAVTPTVNSSGLSDARMDFGGLNLPQGYAFSTGGPTDTNQPSLDSPAQIQIPGGGGDSSRVPVAKRIIPVGPGKWGLAEDVRWIDIKPKLDSLPAYGQGAMLRQKAPPGEAVRPKNSRQNGESRQPGEEHIRQLLASVASRATGSPAIKQVKAQGTETKPIAATTSPGMKVASLTGPTEQAVDIDFVTVVANGSNFVFSANQTYFISSPVIFSGMVDLYGAVIKEADGAYLWCTGPVNCHGNATNMTVITSMNDWAVGENSIPNSSGYPTFSGAPALRLSYTTSAQTLNWLKIRFGKIGLEFDGNGTGMTHSLFNSSIEWCQTGITNYGCTVSLQNCTKCNTTNALPGTFIGTLTDTCIGSENGLLCTWEIEYFAQKGVSGSADPDGDGYNNWYESTNQYMNPRVSDLPRITSQPFGQSVVVGGTASFSVQAAGTGGLTFQWYKAGQPISGAFLATYTISNVQLTNSDTYYVVVNNSYGSALSAPATLSVATASSGTPVPAGVVAWWPGQSNATDVVAGNNGIFNGGYVAGKVGVGFNVVSSASVVRVPATNSLNVGTGIGFTFEGWINPYDNSVEPIFEWAPTNHYGVRAFLSQGNGTVWVSITDIYGISHNFSTGAIVTQNTLQHLAVTYDKASGNTMVYVNGVRKATYGIGSVVPQTGADFWLGCEPGTVVTNGTTLNFNGIIDEASVYNRALSITEIQSIYNAGASGKYLAPTITSPPWSMSASLGGSATFNVSASGVSPYSYQWLFNGTAISSATASSYTVTNVQAGNIGAYSVIVAGPGGSCLSSPALLWLNSCINPPSGMVSWWRGENSATDQVWVNHGTWVGNPGYVAGEAGTAFNLSGSNYIQVADSASLNRTNAFSLEFWYYQATTTPSNVWQGIIGKRAVDPCNYGVNINRGTGLQVYFREAGVGAYQICPVPAEKVQCGAPHHVVGAFQQLDSTHVRITAYIDGGIGFAVTNDVQGNLANALTSVPVVIGGSATNQEPFTGWIDEVTLYSRALSSSEAQQLYYGAGSGKCCFAPTIVTQPQSQTVAQNSSATFSVSASGTPTMGYQWRFNGNSISAATATSYTINNAQPTDAGLYSVVVTNFAGSATSASAALTLMQPPVITMQPTNQIVPAGGSATFAVFTSGSAQLTYQWYYNSQPLSGGVSSSYTISNAGTGNAGTYYVVVANSAGSITSSNATLTIAGCASVTSGLISWWRGEGDATDYVGGNDGRSVGAPGYLPGEVGQGFNLAYTPNQQYIQVESTPSLNLTNAFTVELWYRDMGNVSYWVALAGKCSPVTANFNIALQASNIVSAAFSNPTDGVQSIWVPFTTPGQVHHIACTYQQTSSSVVAVQVYVDGILGASTNLTGSLARSVNDAPFAIGNNFPTGNFFNGVIDEVAIYSRVLSAGEIFSIFSAGQYGKCLPANAPSIILQPTAQTSSIGSDLLMVAQASGTPPLSYQWRLNGASIANATNRVLVLTNVQAAQAGTYSCVASNSLNTATSAGALLTLTNAICVPVPTGIVGWWRGDGTTVDEIGDDTGFLLNGTGYTPGKVGQAFNFPGYPNLSSVSIPSTAALKLTNALTIEFWYKDPNENAGSFGLIGKDQLPGTLSTYGADNFGIMSCGDNYYFQAFLSDTNSGYKGVNFWPVPRRGMFHHMAATYQQTNSNIEVKIFVDGKGIVTNNLPGNLANTISDAPITLGAFTIDGCYGAFPGIIDEFAVYSRALSVTEIASIYNAGAAGKCPTSSAPVISVQPTNQTVAAGSEVLMFVSATGSPRLGYQWKFNGASISGATNKVLILNNVQSSQAGSYTISVSNSVNSVLSQTAVLTVTSAPACTQIPTNIVAWWRGEGNANDAIGANNGSLTGGATYGTGKNGQGFSFSGSGYVSVPDSPSFRFTNGLTVDLWYKDTGSPAWYVLVSKSLCVSPWTTTFRIEAQPNGYMQVLFCDPSVGAQYLKYTPLPVAGMFHHVAATYQQTSPSQIAVKLYIDGQSVCTTNFNGALSNAFTTASMTIGDASTCGGAPFTGIADEVQVYNRVLTVGEIQAIYNAGGTGECWDSDGNGLVDWWEFSYFGHLGNDPNADPDGDGYTNLEECNNRSNPLLADPHAALYEPKPGLNIP